MSDKIIYLKFEFLWWISDIVPKFLSTFYHAYFVKVFEFKYNQSYFPLVKTKKIIFRRLKFCVAR